MTSYRFLSVLLLSLSSLYAGNQFSQQPLRTPLMNKAHFQTSQERQRHRFEGFPVNQYRLYDFYQRQARFHLQASEIPNKLLPYPGLEGGRRGHWGFTNEKTSTAYLRSTIPQFETMTCRGTRDQELGLQFIESGTDEHKAIVVYDTKICGLRAAMKDSLLKSPPSRFGSKVDRYGFFVRIKGEKWLQGPKQQWPGSTSRHLGYYTHGKQAVNHVSLDGVEILEQAKISYLDGKAVLVHQIEFLGEAADLRFKLPVPAAGELEVTQHGPTEMTLSRNKEMISHRFKLSGKGEVFFDEKEACLKIKEISAGTTIYLYSTTEEVVPAEIVNSPILSSLTKGGPTRFPQIQKTSGKVNADPNCSGSAYEIDDIEIPFDNTWNMPMTLSGIDFDSQGNAWVCTMVGDVWRVSGLNDDLKEVSWKRFATGIFLPLGICLVNDVPHVSAQDQIVALHDLNGDNEADYYERFNKVDLPTKGQGRMGLQRDSEGNFYFSLSQGIYKLSKDGRQIEKIGKGSRNPLGCNVRADGLALSDGSEGNKENGTCTIHEASHLENINSSAKNKRILYLPRGIENSCGSRLFLNEERFGPLGKSLIGLSFGRGTSYLILRDANEGTPQAALMPLPGEFASGSNRLKTNPHDGQLYIVGFDGWGDYGVKEGCFHRLRYTGRKALLPNKWQAHSNGIVIHFNKELDPKSIRQEEFFVQQWNYVDSANTYGSAEYSVCQPEQLGHDYLKVSAVRILDDRRSLFIETRAILPAMTTHIYSKIKAADGSSLKLNLFATLNKLRPAHVAGQASHPGKIKVLLVPTKKFNGNTYQTITSFFDKVSGRATIKRAIGQTVAYKKEELSYAWIKSNIIDKQCIMCHAPGTQHDFSSYEKLMHKVNLTEPEDSPFYGMVKTESMPVFPLPTVHKEMQEAILEWIKLGAPK